jgi:hypothetical protein
VIVDLAHQVLVHQVVAHAQVVELVARAVLADDTTDDNSGESKKSGPLGLVIIIVLCIGCYFLFKSMSKHLRRVREEFPTELPEDPLHPTVKAPIKDAESTSSVTPVDHPAEPGSSG